MNLRKAVPNIAFGFSTRRSNVGVISSSDKSPPDFAIVLSFPFAETLFAQKRIDFYGSVNGKGRLVSALEIRCED